MAQHPVQKNIWVADEKHVFVKGQLVNQLEDKVMVSISGQHIEVCLDSTRPYDTSHGDETIVDLAKLNDMSEAPLIGVLRRRFLLRQVYTYVSDIILAVNPYKFYPEHTQIPCPLQDFADRERPHSFAIAHQCYKQLTAAVAGSQQNERQFRNQSVVVSGESGAGKTEACKNVMKYLALLSQSITSKCAAQTTSTGGDAGSSFGDSQPDKLSLEDKVLNCNPFLEAFGNAKTLRNDNSSRFGKFTKIMFDATTGVIKGARIETYLLEKSRVVTQSDDDRSYHIFYYLLAGADANQREKLWLGQPQDYTYLNNASRPCFVIKHQIDGVLVPKVDDSLEFQAVCKALTLADISAATLESIWSVLAAILMLGNITFTDDSGNCRITEDTKVFVSRADHLLGLVSPEDSLGVALTLHVIEVNNVTYKSNISSRDARGNRDALAKKLYEKLFDFLVTRANITLSPLRDNEDDIAFVGVLDIFGFEIFDINSFEQLCINYANEVLQLLFCDHVFKGELAVYRDECIDVSDLDTPNNQPCVDLIGTANAKHFISIFKSLEDKSVAKTEQTDEAFLRGLEDMYIHKRDKLTKRGKRNASYFGVQHKRHETPTTFSIKHFAGTVTYAVASMIKKNRDTFSGHLEELMQNSENSFVCNLFSEPASRKDESRHVGELSSSRRHGPRPGKTIVSTFRSQLSSLTRVLNSTSPHFIRCIKPNAHKLNCDDGASAFDSPMVYSQLLFSGVMQTVKIRQMGFPYRKTYNDLWQDFTQTPILRLLKIPENLGPYDGCSTIVKQTLPEGFFRLGRTKLFAKDGFDRKILQWQQSTLATWVQKWSRWVTCKTRIHLIEGTIRTVQYHWRSVLMHRRYHEIEVTISGVQRLARTILARATCKKALAMRTAGRKVWQVVQRYTLRKQFQKIIELMILEKKYETTRFIQCIARSALANSVMRERQQYMHLLHKNTVALQTLTRAVLAKSDFHELISGFRHIQRLKEILFGSIVHAKLIFRTNRARQRWYFDSNCNFLASTILSCVMRRRFRRLRKVVTDCQRIFRNKRFVLMVARRGGARLRLQSFSRMVLVQCALWKCTSASLRIQTKWRGVVLRRKFRRCLRVLKHIQLKFLRTHLRKLRAQWLVEAQAAIFANDSSKLQRLLDCDVTPFAVLGEYANLVNIRDRVTGHTCLHYTAQAGNLWAMKFLIRNGADARLPDIFGNTALHLACAAGDIAALKLVQYLLATARHSLTSIKNLEGHTPLLVARTSAIQSVGIIRALCLQMGIDLLQGCDDMPTDSTYLFENTGMQIVLQSAGKTFSNMNVSSKSAQETMNKRVLNREHMINGFKSRVGGFNEDDKVLSQLLMLRYTNAIDPVTHHEQIRKCESRSNVRQNTHSLRTAGESNTVKPEGKEKQFYSHINNEDNAKLEVSDRISILRARREARQKELLRIGHLPIPKETAGAFDPKIEQHRGVDPLHMSKSQNKVEQDKVIASVSTNDVHGDVKACQNVVSSLSNRDIASLLQNKRRIRRRQIKIQAQVANDGPDSLENPHCSDASLQERQLSSSLLRDHVINEQKNNGAPTHQRLQSINANQHAILKSLQAYWRIMSVRRSADVNWYCRESQHAPLQGPLTTSDLEKLMESSANASLQCRHSGMPAFVRLATLKGFLLPHSADIGETLRLAQEFLQHKLAASLMRKR